MHDNLATQTGMDALPMSLPSYTPSNVVSIAPDNRSYQQLLASSKGRFVVCNFLIGTDHVNTLSGYLVNVGPNYFILRNPCNGVETTCDIFSLKFVSVYPEGQPDPRDYCLSRFYKPAMDE